MTKARQRDRKRKMVALDQFDRGLMVRIVDVLFHELAATMAPQSVSIEEAVEASWRLFEHGLLRLVPEGESWGVGLCGDIGPCAQAKKTGLWLNGDVRFTDPMLSCSKALYQRLSRQRSINPAEGMFTRCPLAAQRGHH